MCGIAGILSLNNSKIETSIVDNVKRSLEHRGPDHSSHKYISSSICLIHTRLSIIDLNDRSNQPLLSDDGRFTIVFNGEIYNYKEIRKDLEQKDFQFYTSGDTEVLLKGFIAYGEGVLKKLRGQFAFCIYDELTQELFIARDRVGIKPIYYSIHDDWIVFGSEIKAIESSKLIKFEPDEEAYSAYLRHLCTPSNRTGNKNINKIEPGEYIKINKDGKLEKSKYWDPFSFSENNDIDKAEALNEIEKLLIESVEYRKVSDVDVGLFLSGGLDSSLLGKFMKQSSNSTLKAFNIDFDESFEGYKGEAAEAKFASEEIELELSQQKVNFKDFQNILDNYAYFQDDLVGDEVGVPLYFLGKATKSSNIKVVQVGEGADELFYGYEHWNRLLKLSKLMKPYASKNMKFSSFQNHRLNLFSNLISGNTVFAGGALGFNLGEINNLVTNNELINSEVLRLADRHWIEYFSSNNPKLSKWMTLIDLKIRLPELLLMRMDKLVMQSGIEARVPFLDHKLIEFILTVPENIILENFSGKPLLKNIAEKFISKEIIYRKKQGFRAPISNWILKDFRLFTDKIYDFNATFEFFNKKELDNLLKNNDIQKIWYVYNLSNWHMSRIS